MGSGKTTRTVSHLISRQRLGEKFIWIAPRQALVCNTNQRFVSHQMGVINYLNCGNTRQMKLDNINDCQRSLIVECESLHHLVDRKIHLNDILVIDEIETIIKGWDSSTHDKKGKENFHNFIQLAKSAKKIILLDAFLTNTTIDFFSKLGIDDCIIYKSNLVPKKKSLVISHGYIETLNEICKELDDGLKLYVFYTFKSNGKSHYSIDEFKSKILEGCQTKPKILVYHGDVGDDRKKTLNDVNLEWSKYDMILTTSCITVGVNYEGLRFDKIHLMISGYVNNPRDIIQTSMRIRQTKSDKISIFFFDKENKEALKYPLLYNDEEYEHHDLYKWLIDKTYEERQSNFIKVLISFCKLSNYEFSKDFFDQISRENLIKFENNYESKMLMPYDEIEEIDDEMANQIIGVLLVCFTFFDLLLQWFTFFLN